MADYSKYLGLENNEFRKRVTEVIKQKYKNFKLTGALAGAGLGSTVGTASSVIDNAKQQYEGKLDDLSAKEKIKKYLKDSIKPSLIGAGVGGAIGFGGGAYLRSKRSKPMIEKTLSKYSPELNLEQQQAYEELKEFMKQHNMSMKHIDDGIEMNRIRDQKHVLGLVDAIPEENALNLLFKKSSFNDQLEQSAKKNTGSKINLEPVKNTNKIYHNSNTKLVNAHDKRRRENNVNSTVLHTPGLKLAKYL
jgi:hypothetical protein